MDNPKSNEPEQKYGIQRKTLKALGDMKSVIESRLVLQQLKSLADADLASSLKLILDLPDDHPKWEHTVATLIGQARTHRSYSELYTIKEK